MGLEGSYWKGEGIDENWLKKKEAKDLVYGDDDIIDDEAFDEALRRGRIRSKSGVEEIELWDSTDLGRYTINTPTSEKESAEQQDSRMKPVPERDFLSITGEVNMEDAEFQRKIQEMLAEIQS